VTSDDTRVHGRPSVRPSVPLDVDRSQQQEGTQSRSLPKEEEDVCPALDKLVRDKQTHTREKERERERKGNNNNINKSQSSGRRDEAAAATTTSRRPNNPTSNSFVST
jgi:hypothetical protein